MTETSAVDSLAALAGIVGTVAAAFWAGVVGWRSRSRTKALDAPNALIAADIMDTRPMKDLARAVDDMNTNGARYSDRMVDAVDHNTAAVDRMERAIVRTTEAIERKGGV